MKSFYTIFLFLCFIAFSSAAKVIYTKNNRSHKKNFSVRLAKIHSQKYFAKKMIVDNIMPNFSTYEEQNIFLKNHIKLVVLTWNVEQYNQESLYVIERYDTKKDKHIPIGLVEAIHFGDATKSFSFMDTKSVPGNTKYRVKEKIGNKTKTTYEPMVLGEYIEKPSL